MIDKLPPLDGTTIKMGELYDTADRRSDPLSVALLIVSFLCTFFLKRSVFQNRNVSERWTYPDAGDQAVSVVFSRGIAGERRVISLAGDNEFVMSDEQNFIILVLIQWTPELLQN